MTSWTRFVLARFDDDDAALTRRARRMRSAAGAGVVEDAPVGTWSVERMRAETNAKRQLMGTLQELLFLRDLPMEKPVRDAALDMVKSLALPYRDHLEYPGRAPKVVLEAAHASGQHEPAQRIT